LRAAVLAALVLPSWSLADDAAPATSPVPPAEAVRKPTFEVYGFAQVDFIEDFKRVRPDWNATLRPTRIPTAPGLHGENGEAILSARQSRLGVRGSFPAGAYDLFGRIEFDFFGLGEGRPDAGGQNTIRLRQAYGAWGPLLGGLTASLFMDDDFWPTIIDYWGPAGMVFYRNVQIRYTPFTGEHTFAVALERPATDLDPVNGPTWNPGEGTTRLAPRSLLPDLTAQYRLTGEWGYLQLAGILRWLGYDTPGFATQVSGSAVGWGLHASSQVRLLPDRLKLLVAIVGGYGISYYMNDATPDLAFGGTVGSPRGEAVPMLGITAYLDVYWSKLFCSSIGYSTSIMFNTALQGAGSFKSGQYASVNFLVTPVRNLMAGPELLWGERIDKGGAYGTDIRLQISVKYSFTSLDFWKPN
jgi:sulfur carrier protein ThiS